MANFEDSIKKIKKLQKYMQNDAIKIIGTEAVNHFKESFENEGFTDKSLEKWQEVKRRQGGTWKGFQYGSTVRREGTKQRKQGAITNYSPAAEQRKILTGVTLELAESIDYIPDMRRRGVYVYAKVPYAKIHNEGGMFRVFGKALRRMPKRQFMGKSRTLRLKIRAMIMNDIKKLLK